MDITDDFGIGMTSAIFHVAGTVRVLIELLIRWVSTGDIIVAASR